ncbi:unnamed protein product [Schistosoma turkestanicum]|nr:unnamed protein product [Schistosoma turkestanicum]
MLGDRQLSIISPATRDKEVFKWVSCKPGEIKDENSEIVDVISWVVSDIREMSENPILVELLKVTDRSCYDDVSKLCDVYNKTIIDLWNMWDEGNIVPEFFNRKASRDHVQFILLQCYNRAVSDPEKLNQYPPFSPQVYGETSFELISQMIDTITVASDDIFIDLGSGVGQVVLQVCASTDAKFCYGIEKAEYPANCASRLDSAFRHWMGFYGKSYRPYTLERGDFLSTEYQEKITNASVLFANNFAFGPEVDHQLKQRFANLKEGARIISSKAFCPLNFRITDRNLGDIGSIMRVSCLNPIQDAVSWTDKPFSYYVHTIDRSLLEQYFARLKNPKSKDENHTVRRDRKGRVISETTMREGSVQLTVNTNGNISHKSRQSSTITKHRSNNTFRCLPKRSPSLPELITASSPSKLISIEGRKLSLQHCLTKRKTIKQQGSTTGHRIKPCHSQYHQSQLKHSSSLSQDIFTLSCNDDTNTTNTTTTNPVESHIDDTQPVESTQHESVVCDDNQDKNQFSTVIPQLLLLNNPCETQSLSKSNTVKQTIRRIHKYKTMTTNNNDKLIYNYQMIDDCFSSSSSSTSSSLHDQQDSRNSSSSPYISSLSSANRSPNSQTDEITSSLSGGAGGVGVGGGNLTNHHHTGLTLKSIQSSNLSIIPEDKLDKDNKNDDSMHIRIKFKMSTNTSDNQNHPPVSVVEIKPSLMMMNDGDDDHDDTISSNNPCDIHAINEKHLNNVANRRIVRKCRQLLSSGQTPSSSSLNVTNVVKHSINTNRPIVLRKRIQKHLIKNSTKHHTTTTTNNNKLKKHTRKYSRDDLHRNMNILHDYTVTQSNSMLSSNQFGLNDKRFSSPYYYTCHYQPIDVLYTESCSSSNNNNNRIQLNYDSNLSDPHIGYNKVPVPFALTQYLEQESYWTPIKEVKTILAVDDT